MNLKQGCAGCGIDQALPISGGNQNVAVGQVRGNGAGCISGQRLTRLTLTDILEHELQTIQDPSACSRAAMAPSSAEQWPGRRTDADLKYGGSRRVPAKGDLAQTF